MSAWLLARAHNGTKVYFTGETHPSGCPKVSQYKHEGFHFSSPRAAYEAADTHELMRGSLEWRAVPR